MGSCENDGELIMLYLQCPFKSWWKARKVFRTPRFKFYFGPLEKVTGAWYKGGDKAQKESANKMLDSYIRKKLTIEAITIFIIQLITILFFINHIFLVLLVVVTCFGLYVKHALEYMGLEAKPVDFNLKAPMLSTEDRGFVYFVSRDYLKWWSKLPITIDSRDVGWKEKWGEARYERPGFFSIIIGRNFSKAWQFCMYVKEPLPRKGPLTKKKFMSDEIYWTMLLTYVYFADCNIEKAKELLSGCWSGTDGIETPEWYEDFLREGK